MSYASRVLAIVSGGMDSATLVYHLRRRYRFVGAVSFDYGQRHRKELEYAAALAVHLDMEHQVINLGGLCTGLRSALTDKSIDVPHGHYESEMMKATVVPARNSIMVACAWGIAVSSGYDAVALGVHAGDHAIYPDCRPEWVEAIEHALQLGTDTGVQLHTPFMNMTKTDIAQRGWEMGVPYGMTWTCYEGGEHHCGKCGACQERKEAFRDSATADPTEYAA